MSLWAVILVVVLLAGCTSTLRWDRPGTTEQQFRADSYACASEARQTRWQVGGPVWAQVKDRDMVNKDLYRACLQARGYQRADGGSWEGVY